MSVKVGSGQISGLQQSLLDFQKLKIGEIKKEVFELKSDSKEISKDALNLKNIDADKSDVVYNNQVINFNLVFNIFVQAELKIKGFVRTEEKCLEACFTYLFQKDVVENNKVVPGTFILILKMKAGFDETISYEKKNDKADILKFIERLVTDIFDEFNDGYNSLRTLFINQEDFKRIANTDKDDLARLIQSLLGAVFSFIKFRDINSPGNSQVGLTIITNSKKHEAKQYAISKLQSFSIEINQVDSAEKHAR
jgi:hypothetical protein